MHRMARTQTTPTALPQLVARQAKAAHLIEPAQRLLVAVSGGPDSVALLSILNELAPAWRLTLHAAHINYGLRGEESEEDARFVARLCDRFGVPLHCERVDLAQRGIAGHRSSIQERARDARYQILARLASVLASDRIVLGHQADDQAETVLMWMLRGAGTAGLAGVPPIRDSLFIRPLLGVTRDAILQYLWSRELPFRVDSSNAAPIYLRNRIRHALLPAMKRFNPSVVEGLARQADILREEDAYLQQAARAAMATLTRDTDEGTVVDRAGVLALPLALQRRIVRCLLQDLHPQRKGPGFKTIGSLLEIVFRGKTGASLVTRGVRITREYAAVRFHAASSHGVGEAISRADAGLALPIPSSILWPPTGQRIRASVGPPFLPSDRRVSHHHARIDLDLVSTPLTVRSWKPGDAFQPAGMGGRTKKLQDYFSDIKLPRQARARVPIVWAPEGILWVGGHRTDHRFCAKAGAQRILGLELMEGRSEGGAS